MKPQAQVHQGTLAGSRVHTESVAGIQRGAPTGGSDMLTAKIQALYAPFLPVSLTDEESDRLLMKLQKIIKAALK